MLDWNALYSNEQPPSLEQVTEYINNPLWTDFNNHIQSTYRSRQAGILRIKRWKVSLYALSDARLFYRSCGCRKS